MLSLEIFISIPERTVLQSHPIPSAHVSFSAPIAAPSLINFQIAVVRMQTLGNEQAHCWPAVKAQYRNKGNQHQQKWRCSIRIIKQCNEEREWHGLCKKRLEKRQIKVMWMQSMLRKSNFVVTTGYSSYETLLASFVFVSSGRSRERLFIRRGHVLSVTFSSASASLVSPPIRVNWLQPWLLTGVCRSCPVICGAEVTATACHCLWCWNPAEVLAGYAFCR